MALNSAIGSSSVATIYLVVRLLRTEDAWLWPIGYAVYLAALVLPYIALAYAWIRMPRLAAHINAGFTRVANTDLRRPGAGLLAAVGLGLVTFASWGFITAS